MTYNIVEIFHSIEGEGKRAGQSATFIRLAGCNLRCSYCDTTYAMDGTFTEMTLDEIITQVKSKNIPRVTITGGEPLLTKNVNKLLQELLKSDIDVNIETNGSIDIANFAEEHDKNLFFTMDYKLPSSGETNKMHIPNFNKLAEKDVLKFVISDEHDVEHMINFLRTLKSNPQIYIGAVFGKYNLQNLVAAILKYPELKNATLQLQLHKIIWDPNDRGV